MQWNSRWMCVLLAGCVLNLAGAAAQRSSTTEVKQFEIVAVDGNKVLVKDAQGAQEITVPDDFKLTVDGRPVTVHELMPGMKGTATITTTTTVTPVHITEVRNAEVVKVSGNSIIVKGQNGFREFTESEIAKRDITMVKDGRPAKFSDFSAGDRLTAQIVTTGTPRVMTERQVQASLASAPPPARSAASTSGAAAEQSARAATPPPPAALTGRTAAAGAVEPGTPPAQLPKTASVLPLIGLFGIISLALAMALTLRRFRTV